MLFLTGVLCVYELFFILFFVCWGATFWMVQLIVIKPKIDEDEYWKIDINLCIECWKIDINLYVAFFFCFAC